MKVFEALDTLDEWVQTFAVPGTPEALRVVAAHIEQASDQRDAVLGLHRRGPDDDETCTECAGLWPCPTARALGITS